MGLNKDGSFTLDGKSAFIGKDSKPYARKITKKEAETAKKALKRK